MKEIFVHVLRYHYSGRGNRKSRIMFPISYGPFKDEDAAREWIRQTGITQATKLMSIQAPENVNVPNGQLPQHKKAEIHPLLPVQVQQPPVL